MAKRRPQGDGTIRKRSDGRWEGRIIVGHKDNGKPMYKSVFGKTQKATLKELHRLIDLYRDVELTEDSIEKNLEVAIKNISRVKEFGFSVALDDVGSGYTSLVNLCEYPIDVVKVDRGILLRTTAERGKKLFYGIVSFAHYLNLKVVCEGVETEDQNVMVSESDCDFIQGWYYSKGLSEEDAETFAREYMSRA